MRDETGNQAWSNGELQGKAPSLPQPLIDFNKLIQNEFDLLHWPEITSSSDGLQVSPPGPAAEPWVTFSKRDHFGLALSGGGIRSATFNLGLLQGLNRYGVLNHVDYLSTVSGGGYIGGFWTAWRYARANDKASSPDRVFPSCPTPRQADNRPQHQSQLGSDPPPAVPDLRECRELRHLREFSRFLVPRVGFTHIETWSGFMTVLSGLVPALAATVAFLILAIYVWFGMSFVIIRYPLFALLLPTLVIVALQIHSETEWRRRELGAGADAILQILVHYLIVFVCAAITFGACWVWRYRLLADMSEDWMVNGLSSWRAELPGDRPFQYYFNIVYFGPAVAWSVTSLVLLPLHLVFARFEGGLGFYTAMLQRCMSRYFAPSCLWGACAFIWEFCRWLQWLHWTSPVSAATPFIFGGLFLWARKWLETPVTETRGTRLVHKWSFYLKPRVPELFAAAAVTSLVIVVVVLLQALGLRSWLAVAYAGGGSVIAIVLTISFFDPARIGLHDFYRGRIARCFLGAAQNVDAAHNRATSEQKGDDFLFADLSKKTSVARPIHLICCTANNLSGDILGSLYRGGRSAVLSAQGISLGDATRSCPDLRFSSALTASAAAFNSQMGRISMRLGSAVSILMTALNLRLGLWVPHPESSSTAHRHFPGLFFFSEMFGRTRCDPGRPHTSYLHLSDGGHFENLALYELIRRHCRFVIVSDCAADPAIKFDDLANALRSVREDFGVEVDLDVSPIRPPGTDKLSAQHAVVGTIHYNGPFGADKGTILYFKPSITGDEPPDVLQYHARNQAFPHENTGEQFYDEAQWESYRRLGEHAALSVLSVLDLDCTTCSIERLFFEAGQQWHPTLPGQDEVFLQLTQRCTALESSVRDDAPSYLRAEFFPEVVEAWRAPSATIVANDDLRTIYFIMLCAQLMEDTWLAAKLDAYWSHPLNQGWMRYFQRWASTPSFRRWWPIIRPLYSRGFGQFVGERFDLHIPDVGQSSPAPGPRFTLKSLSQEEAKSGLAWRLWEDRYGPPPCSLILALDLELEGTAEPFQVGFLLYKGISPCNTPYNDPRFSWLSTHLFVPPALRGAGIQSNFLDAIISHFESENARELQVVLNEEGEQLEALTHKERFRYDPARLQQRVETINFYKSRGFLYKRSNGPLHMLTLELPRNTKLRLPDLAEIDLGIRGRKDRRIIRG